MRVAKDTTLRFLATLQILPVYPSRISTRDIQSKLQSKDDEYNVDIRTIQRDLDKLSGIFPISSDTEGRTNYWYWVDKNALTQIPAMGHSTALAFKLASEYLRPIMPPGTLKLLEPYFNHANQVLKGTKLGNWSKKAKIINRGPKLLSPKIKAEVQECIYTALLENKQLELDYKSRGEESSKRFTLHPLGIVFRDGVIYLVATLWNYQEPMHFALHRMNKPLVLDKGARKLPGFSLSQHIEEDKEFSYPISDLKIKLCALFSEGAAIHLQESKLAEDQEIEDRKDGSIKLTATVTDSDELRWWLLGFGEQVEVVAPKTLREEFHKTALAMKKRYSN